MKADTHDTYKLAQRIAKDLGIPVFPTRNKRPALSNGDLAQLWGRKVKRGEGGFKMASTKPHMIKALFEAANTKEIAVPMGPKSRGGAGYLVVDVDMYKDSSGPNVVGDNGVKYWHDDNKHLLEGTLTHGTRSGGIHYIFEFPNDLKHPATLRPGVDLKGFGGYICWPGTPGYEVINDAPVLPFPMELITNTGTLAGAGHNQPPPDKWNEATDDELVAAIQSAEELYPALRTLAWRMAGTVGINARDAEKVLRNVMKSSAAASETHRRHEDWLERFGKIENLVISAFEKKEHPLGQVSDLALEGLAAEEQFLPTVINSAEKVAREPRVAGPIDPFKPDDPSDLPPREWLYGHHMIRGFLTATVSPGGMGKSSLLIAEALSMATGNEVLGVTVYEPIRVLYWCGEDPTDELHKRFSAAMKHYDISYDDLGDRLFVMSGRQLGFNFAYTDHQDAMLNDEDIELVRGMIRDLKIDLLILDPMASIHSINENSNNEMTLLLDALRQIADDEHCGIEIVHHSTKAARTGGAAMGAEQARGASAITDAARSVRALSKMTKQDREDAGMSEAQAKDIALVRSVKGNMSPGERTSAIKLISVDMGNRSSLYPKGDSVGVVEPFTIDRSAKSDWVDSIINQLDCLDLIAEQPEPWRKDMRSGDWAGTHILAATGQASEVGQKQFAKDMLERLEIDGMLTIEPIKTKNGRVVETYKIDMDRLAEIRASLTPHHS